MSRGDGRNLKFRVLCRKCNSYQYTHVIQSDRVVASFFIECRKCGNTADSFEEEQ